MTHFFIYYFFVFFFFLWEWISRDSKFFQIPHRKLGEYAAFVRVQSKLFVRNKIIIKKYKKKPTLK